MNTILASLGMYFLGAVACTIVAIIFVEGPPIPFTIAAYAVTYFAAAALLCKAFPKLWWSAGIIIPGFLWLDFWILSKGLSSVFLLISKPSLINSRNYFDLLPLVAIIAAVCGSYVGMRWARSQNSLSSGGVEKRTVA